MGMSQVFGEHAVHAVLTSQHYVHGRYYVAADVKSEWNVISRKVYCAYIMQWHVGMQINTYDSTTDTKMHILLMHMMHA